jgi:iron-sulfur cluster repair protein YtfE (RIC family)
MIASHLIDFNEFSPGQLSDYIEHNLYGPLHHSLESLHQSLEKALATSLDADKIGVIALLVNRLREETEQLMRNDELVIFPLIRRGESAEKADGPKIPQHFIRSKNERIINLLEKLRQLSNNYMLQPNWNHEAKLFFEHLFQVDQSINQCIFLKENVLLPKLQNVAGAK